MLISVEFWKSMHGFAVDSRTRAARPIERSRRELSIDVEKLSKYYPRFGYILKTGIAFPKRV